MYKNKRIAALVPLRGGSKSIPYKNIRPIAGKPLCFWVLAAACDSKYIDGVYVSTEDRKIKAAVESLGLPVKITDRPEELARDDSTTESVMADFMGKVPFDILVTIQATSPTTDSRDLDAAIEQFFRNGNDSLLTGTLQKKFFWTPGGTPLNFDYRNRPMRQQFAGVIHENGAFYITARSLLEKERCRLGGKIGIFVLAPEKDLDIDEPGDWPDAEKRLLATQKK